MKALEAEFWYYIQSRNTDAVKTMIIHSPKLVYLTNEDTDCVYVFCVPWTKIDGEAYTLLRVMVNMKCLRLY